MTQKEALAILQSGQSVLLTGAAGSGKTYVLNRYIKRARRAGKKVAVTATTGLAATHLNGTTLHAWSGIGVKDELPRGFINHMTKQRRDIIRGTDVLVIDEISMLHDFRLDMVDQVLRMARDTNKPFGGLQVILCGDFFQLPPVNRTGSRNGSFITTSDSWRDTDFGVCYLSEQHRQIEDDYFTQILNNMRHGMITRSQLSLLNERINAELPNGVVPTRLHTTNADVDQINSVELDQLEGETHSYYMTTTGKKNYVETLLKSVLAPQTLELKLGALVMCIKNSPDKKYVNGSLGKVIDFEELSDYPVIELNDGRTITVRPETWELIDGDVRRAQAMQLPLRLAWAITVHKSQGMTLDAAHIDLSRAFVEGMGYVALSRVRSLEYLSLLGLNTMALRISPVALQIERELQERSESTRQRFDDVIRQAATEPEPSDDDNGKPDAKPKTAWSERLEKMRLEYPNAFKPWKQHDDSELLAMYQGGAGLKELAGRFGRQPGSIKSRLKKHLGEDITIDA